MASVTLHESREELAPPARVTTWPVAKAGAPTVEIVVPVYNEERALASSVRRLHAYLDRDFPFSCRVTIADNASTDATLEIARELAGELDDVRAVHVDAKGRGRALQTVWSVSDAAVLTYMDVDLSTRLAALLPLVAPIISGHSDLAIGTRLAHGARIVRGPKRDLISRCYNLLLRGTLRARFSDAQCGFKAVSAGAARVLLPLVEDSGWFFDTELLVLAERAGMRIHEVPVDWIDDPDSRVDIVATALADLQGIARMRRCTAKPEVSPAGECSALPMFDAMDIATGVRTTYRRRFGDTDGGKRRPGLGGLGGLKPRPPSNQGAGS